MVGSMATYVITGATRGIGRAVVDLLADEDLILVARAAGPLLDLATSLPSARAVAVDLATPAEIDQAMAAVELPERIDGVVHSAGVAVGGRIADVTVAEWTRQFAVNVTAVAELTRHLLPGLRAAAGTVVAVNSGAGLAVKGPGGAAYSASKHALRALADKLRFEEPDIRVTTVYPGRTDTDMQRQLVASEGREYDPAEFIDPVTLAQLIVTVLRLPADSTVADLTVTPNH
jgi:NADP-dependent 3-hydroxy acid dehydrogenase YdfG